MVDLRLTLGTAQLGMAYGVTNRRGQPSPEEVEAILRRAFDLGVRSLDTAADYGVSEALIGRYLRRHGRPPGLVLCTKLPRLPRDLRPDRIDGVVSDALQGSLRRLGVDRVDHYLIHAQSDLIAHGRPLIEALVSCRQSGLVRRIGASVYTPEDARVALSHPELSSIQFPFNLFDRRVRDSGALAELRSAGYATFARSPLLQGLLTLAPDALPRHLSDARPRLAALRDGLTAWSAEPVATALAWAVARSGADSVVLGVDSPDQLDFAVRALGRPLPHDLLDALEAHFADVPVEVIDPRRWVGTAP